MTKYLILGIRKNGPGWEELGHADAVSAAAAIRAHLKDAEDANGEYVAVPARSWQPITVKVETVVKFS